MIPFTLTNDVIAVVIDGKPVVVARGTPNFAELRRAILEERWADVPKHLSPGRSLEEWAKGKFTVAGDKISYDGKELPAPLIRRISTMAASGANPEPLFKFWERLQQNPSHRSVSQLWDFLAHEHIPLTDDGCFLAYKAVTKEYKDIHSNTVRNTPGTLNKMPRNLISDDPSHACHYGFHVGALAYAENFGGSDSKLVVCKVKPEHVVCVPYDHNAMKMRVEEYEVIGNHGCELPSTVIPEYDLAPGEEDTYHASDDDLLDEDYEEDFLEDEEEMEEDCEDCDGSCGCADPDPPPAPAEPKRKSARGFARMDKLDLAGLMDQSLADLRRYASKGLKIINAYRIPGGKLALVTRILAVRA